MEIFLVAFFADDFCMNRNPFFSKSIANLVKFILFLGIFVGRGQKCLAQVFQNGSITKESIETKSLLNNTGKQA
jgi:hypothetical protein